MPMQSWQSYEFNGLTIILFEYTAIGIFVVGLGQCNLLYLMYGDYSTATSRMHPDMDGSLKDIFAKADTNRGTKIPNNSISTYQSKSCIDFENLGVSVKNLACNACIKFGLLLLKYQLDL